MARIYLALYPRRFSTHTQRKRVDRRCVPLIDEEDFFLYRLFFPNFKCSLLLLLLVSFYYRDIVITFLSFCVYVSGFTTRFLPYGFDKNI